MWQRALADEGRFLRIAVLVQVIAHLAFAVAGLIVHPDFAVGSEATAQKVLGVDFNGWHAIGGFLLFGPGLIAVRRTDWTLWYSLAAIVAAMVPGIWALYDDTPAGLFALPDGTADFIYHLIGAGLLAATVVIHVLLANRRAALTST